MKNWTEAKEYCHSHAMDLVTIETLEENRVIAVHAKSVPGLYIYDNEIEILWLKIYFYKPDEYCKVT
jgi:hypothetical protein